MDYKNIDSNPPVMADNALGNIPFDIQMFSSICLKIAENYTKIKSQPVLNKNCFPSWVTSSSLASRKSSNLNYQSLISHFSINNKACQEISDLFDDLFMQSPETKDRHGTNDLSGGYLAYAPTGALAESALASFASSLINPGLTWMPTSPGFCAIEQATINWVAETILNWPTTDSDATNVQPSFGGIFTSGGSVANTLGLHVARESIAKSSPGKVLFFIPEHAHYCFAKALRILGISAEQVITLKTNECQQICMQELTKTLQNHKDRLDQYGGVIVAVAGETSTGSIDPLKEIHGIMNDSLWLHIDACFGGFFALTDKGKSLLEGIVHGHSISLDPHKAMQLPYGTGLLMVRNKSLLKRAFLVNSEKEYVPPSLQNRGSNSIEIDDISNLGLELTREARAVSLWAPLKSYGSKPFEQHLSWCLESAKWLEETVLATIHELEAYKYSSLSTVLFKFKSGEELVSNDEKISWLVDELNSQGDFLVAPTKVKNDSYLRVCVLSKQTKEKNLVSLVKSLSSAVLRILDSSHRINNARKAKKKEGFRIPYALSHIPGKGVGIVATEFIAKNSLVWEYEEGTCEVLTDNEVKTRFQQYSHEEIVHFIINSYGWNEAIYFPLGDTKFFNHSPTPDILTNNLKQWFAARDIFPGEEIMDNYASYQKNEVLDFFATRYKIQSCTQFANGF